MSDSPVVDHVSLDDLSAQLAKDYIYPYLWEGEVLYGLGADKIRTQILDFAHDPVLTAGLKSTKPVFISPNLDRPRENSYHIAFPGGQFGFVVDLINLVKDLGVRSQRYDFVSYLSSQPPKPGDDVYKLIIEVDYNTVRYTVKKLDWIILDDEKESKFVASWDTNLG